MLALLKKKKLHIYVLRFISCPVYVEHIRALQKKYLFITI